jgi:chromosomal replication initiation ATPase DnaA
MVATREEVLRQLERARKTGTQIVVTSLRRIERDTRPFFAGATFAEVGELSVSGRLEVASLAAASYRIDVPLDTLRGIAERVEGGAPQVRSAVARIAAEAIAREERSRV